MWLVVFLCVGCLQGPTKFYPLLGVESSDVEEVITVLNSGMCDLLEGEEQLRDTIDNLNDVIAQQNDSITRLTNQIAELANILTNQVSIDSAQDQVGCCIGKSGTNLCPTFIGGIVMVLRMVLDDRG